MTRRTKIVCTLGPATNTKERINDLIDLGMNVARLNCSHGDWETKKKWIEWIREADRTVAPVAILADLQGPKFRVGDFPEGHIEVKSGDTVTIGKKGSQVEVPSETIRHEMKPGDRVLLGDGNVEIKLVSGENEIFTGKIVSGGLIKSRQGITLVNKAFKTPAMTEQDMADVAMACSLGVDFIALSYVRNAWDLRELRKQVDQYDPTIKLCAKIETREALKEIDDIIQACDLIMVARGDLGLQINFEEVPFEQKRVIRRCNIAGKPVITATQMLESMVAAPRPTRAEATDVANAILDGSDALMLSGETAAGDFPLEAVKAMAKIAVETESGLDYEERLVELERRAGKSTNTESVAHAAVGLAHSLKCKAIVTTSTTGATPRLVSKYRPKPPIFCGCYNERTQRQLSVVWGVEAIFAPVALHVDQTVENVIENLLRLKRLKIGDHVVVTAGTPPGKPGNTNMILVETVR